MPIFCGKGFADDTLKEIARLKLLNLGNKEIAERIGKVRRTVERKIEMIQMLWGNRSEPTLGVAMKIKLPKDELSWQRMSIPERIDALSDAFENAWESGASPQIADYAELFPRQDRIILIRELMLVARQLSERDQDQARSQSVRRASDPIDAA